MCTDLSTATAQLQEGGSYKGEVYAITETEMGRQKEKGTSLKNEGMENKRCGLDTRFHKLIYTHPQGAASYNSRNLRFLRFPVCPHQITQLSRRLINVFIKESSP